MKDTGEGFQPSSNISKKNLRSFVSDAQEWTSVSMIYNTVYIFFSSPVMNQSLKL